MDSNQTVNKQVHISQEVQKQFIEEGGQTSFQKGLGHLSKMLRALGQIQPVFGFRGQHRQYTMKGAEHEVHECKPCPKPSSHAQARKNRKMFSAKILREQKNFFKKGD